MDGRITAWRIIRREGFTALPISPRKIIKKHGIKLIDYTRFAEICLCTRESIIADYDEDGFLFPLNDDTGKPCYCIVYNEDKDEERINWTLMHELCHYFLGHVRTRKDVLKRSKADKSELDKQADALCARLFCPTVILHMCCVESAQEISELCGISFPAALNRWNHLKKARHYKKFLTLPEEREILRQFEPFICRYLCEKAEKKLK